MKGGKHIIFVEDSFLRYPFGEKVPVEFKIEVKVLLRKYSLTISMFIVEIENDCLLDVGFLRKVNLGNIFDFAFDSSETRTLFSYTGFFRGSFYRREKTL